MKQDVKKLIVKKYTRQLFVCTGLILLLSVPVGLQAQTDSTTKKESSAVKEEASLISPSIVFTSVQKGDKTIDLKTALKAKVKGSFIKLPALKVSFLQISDTAEKELGFIITDGEGKATLNVKADELPTNKEGKLHFKAVFAGNKAMDPAEEELTIKRALLVATPVKGDSLNSIHVKLVDLSTGAEVAVPDAALGLFVKRSFFPLKVGEGTTDANGEVTIDVPKNLPGDAKGNITLIARLDENELYGNLEGAVVQQWGVPISDIDQKLPRALWSTHPPMWMMITFAVLITIVWGHYIVIIFELFRLRKEEPHELQNTGTA
jgi:hypothetical protein